MVTRLERQARPAARQGVEEGEEDNQEQLMAFLQRHAHQAENQQQKLEEEEDEEITEEEEHNEDEDEEEDSLVSGQYHEGIDYVNQSTSSSLQVPSPSLLLSWSYQENEVGDESDRATSASPVHQNLPSQPYYPNTPQSSPSITVNSSIVSLCLFFFFGISYLGT